MEQAVWDHVAGLLSDPAQLLAQFERSLAESRRRDAAGAGGRAQLRARLDRLARADQRLLEAYQAEVISLEELPSGAARCRENAALASSSSASSTAAYAAARPGAGGC